MSLTIIPNLCNISSCRRLSGHKGNHDIFPTAAWDFMAVNDKNKLTKAGFATPRGGAKGAYQNHVVRSNKVIVPYEKLDDVPLNEYKDGYVIRMMPEQYFGNPGIPKAEFTAPHSRIAIGENAFILYRTHHSFETYPPLVGWTIRKIFKKGSNDEGNKRGIDIEDRGHYVLRLSTMSTAFSKVNEGNPQGLFAPEYANAETNYLAKCVLAWLLVHTVASPYTTQQAAHLQAILQDNGLLNDSLYERNGSLRHGLCAYPLCLRLIQYKHLHQIISFDDAIGNLNAANQVEGATRSTIVNLFHIYPLSYSSIRHIPQNVAWGHATCNTLLGQRQCMSLADIQESGLKVGIILENGIETFGWITQDFEMLRSPQGAVWIRLCTDITEDESALPETEDENLPIIEYISEVSDDAGNEIE